MQTTTLEQLVLRGFLEQPLSYLKDLSGLHGTLTSNLKFLIIVSFLGGFLSTFYSIAYHPKSVLQAVVTLRPFHATPA